MRKLILLVAIAALSACASNDVMYVYNIKKVTSTNVPFDGYPKTVKDVTRLKHLSLERQEQHLKEWNKTEVISVDFGDKVVIFTEVTTCDMVVVEL